MKQHHKLLIALVAGALLGVVLHDHAASLQNLITYVLDPLGQIFLRFIFMAVVPLVFCGLVLGVHELSRHHGLGKIVSKTFVYTILLSACSVMIGIAMVNTFKPGVGMSHIAGIGTVSVEKLQQNAQAAKPIVQALLEIIPKNPIDAAARALDGEMLALMFFALVFGIALTRKRNVSEDRDPALLRVLERVYDACMTIVEFAMKIAPYAVFALVFSSTLKFGTDLLLALGKYVAVVVGALLIQQFVVYAGALRFIARTSPWKFFSACREVYLYAFATASSNATLPLSLETAEVKLKLPADSSRFVLTVGSTANQNGTALFEGVTVLFLAQFYGIDLSFSQQLKVVVMSILAGIGTAGVPGGSLPLILILVQSLGIPAEGMGIILGVDRFLDMCRTTINVSGDLVIARLVSARR